MEPPFVSALFVSLFLVPLSNVISFPFVVVEGFEPNENVAGDPVFVLLLFGLPKAKPLLFVATPNPVLAVPFDGLLRKSKLLPPAEAALKPPNPAKTLGAPS